MYLLFSIRTIRFKYQAIKLKTKKKELNFISRGKNEKKFKSQTSKKKVLLIGPFVKTIMRLCVSLCPPLFDSREQMVFMLNRGSHSIMEF